MANIMNISDSQKLDTILLYLKIVPPIVIMGLLVIIGLLVMIMKSDHRLDHQNPITKFFTKKH